MIITREHRTKPYPLGVHVVAGGLEVAVHSETADAVDLCVFDDAGRETAHRLQERSGHVFHGRVDGLGAGTRYGLRVDGAWDPANGLRRNRHKLLLDPYARALEGELLGDEAVFSHRFSSPDELNPTDSAPFVPRCVVTDGAFDWATTSTR